MSEPRPGYGPYEIVDDPAEFGLVTSTVSSGFGTCVARHPAIRASERATIFLHGAAGSWTTWTPLLAAARRHDVELGDTVLLDLPGWGDAVMTAGVHETVAAIGSLVRVAAQSLGYTEWRLVGHSLGGFVALHLAATTPRNVLSVGMVSGTTFSVIRSVERPFRRFGELPGFTALWRGMQLLSRLGPAGTGFVRALDRIGLLRPITFPLFRHWRAVPRSQARALARDVRPHAFASAARAVRGYDADALWSRIECPVRATRGDRDVFVTARDFSHLARILPDSVLTVVPDCGHFGLVERPMEVLAALGYTASPGD